MLAHAGLADNPNNQQIMSLLSLIVQTPWDGGHSCTGAAAAGTGSDCLLPACTLCEFSLLWYQLSTKVLEFVAPATESAVPVQDVPSVEVLLEARAAKTAADTGKSSSPVSFPPRTPFGHI